MLVRWRFSEPDEDAPSLVTDISAADLRSWSGAGPLPRARPQSAGSGSAAKMIHVVETAVRIEPWEVRYARVLILYTVPPNVPFDPEIVCLVGTFGGVLFVHGAPCIICT